MEKLEKVETVPLIDRLTSSFVFKVVVVHICPPITEQCQTLTIG